MIGSDVLSGIKEVETIVPDIELRTALVPLALGMVIGRLIALPSSIEESHDVFYNESNMSFIDDMISKVNEQVILNVTLAKDVALKVFMVRYFALYPRTVRVTQSGSILGDLFDITSQFETVDLTVAREHKRELFLLMPVMTKLLNNK